MNTGHPTKAIQVVPSWEYKRYLLFQGGSHCLGPSYYVFGTQAPKGPTISEETTQSSGFMASVPMLRYFPPLIFYCESLQLPIYHYKYLTYLQLVVVILVIITAKYLQLTTSIVTTLYASTYGDTPLVKQIHLTILGVKQIPLLGDYRYQRYYRQPLTRPHGRRLPGSLSHLAGARIVPPPEAATTLGIAGGLMDGWLMNARLIHEWFVKWLM